MCPQPIDYNHSYPQLYYTLIYHDTAYLNKRLFY